jgi:hypothetical protein
LVAIVTPPRRPLCATISASRSTFSGFALSTYNVKLCKSETLRPTRCKIPALLLNSSRKNLNNGQLPGFMGTERMMKIDHKFYLMWDRSFYQLLG